MENSASIIRDILFIGSSYLIIAFFISIITLFVLRLKVLGRFWMVLLIATIGAIFGGVFYQLLFPVIQFLANLNGGKINIFPPLICSIFCVWIYSLVGRNK